MRRIMHTLHMHRGSNPPLSVRKARNHIHRVVEPILDAFELDYSRVHSSDNVSYYIRGCSAIPQAERNFVPRLAIPVSASESFSLGNVMTGDFRYVAWVAGVESALACRRAGLVRNYCDPFHWDRMTDERTPPAVVEGLSKLALSPGAATLPVPETDPEGKAAAAMLSSMLGPRYIVILFGSRQRGDNLHDSDVDVMVQATGDFANRLDDGCRIIKAVTNGNTPPLDISFIAQWGGAGLEKSLSQAQPRRRRRDGVRATGNAHSRH